MVGDALVYAVGNMASQTAMCCKATLCLGPPGRERQSSRGCVCQCCPETLQGMNMCISRKEQQLRMDKRHSKGHPPKACNCTSNHSFLEESSVPLTFRVWNHIWRCVFGVGALRSLYVSISNKTLCDHIFFPQTSEKNRTCLVGLKRTLYFLS